MLSTEPAEPLLQAVYQAILTGDLDQAHPRVAAALQGGIAPARILNEPMMAAMAEVGRLFEAGDFYVPEMLAAATTMQAGLELLKPLLASGELTSSGTVIIGTVKGDMHDIGKNLVAMMLEGAGFEIIDLGVDASAEKFIHAARERLAENIPVVLAMSALITTTMPYMETVIAALVSEGVRDRLKVLVGGAPLSEEFAAKVGADGFAPDASRAVARAKRLLDV